MGLLILVRHGESMANVQHVLSDYKDKYGLSEIGEDQAERTGIELKRFKINKFYTSPVLRTLQTSKIISKHIKIEPILDDRLWERHFKEMNGMRSLEGYWRFNTSKEFESWKSVEIRTLSFINDLNLNACTLAVTHHDIISNIIGRIYSMDELQSYGITPKYASMTILELKKNKKLELLGSSLPKIPDTLIKKIPNKYLF